MMPNLAYIINFCAKIDKRNSSGLCWIWTGCLDEDGYGHSIPFLGSRWKPHRIAYFLETGIDPGELLVCHTCDNPPCVNPSHLWIGTALDNGRDCNNKGRRPIGEKSICAKLTEEDVVMIRSDYASGLYAKEIAAKYNITEVNVTSVAIGRTWKHLPGICERRVNKWFRRR